MEKNFLGLDWGERKIGIALAHAETRVAVAYGMVENDQALLPTLERLVREEEVGLVIVGLPRRKEVNQAEHPAKQFGQRLAKELGVEVIYMDEMFTSKLAQDTLKLLGGKQVQAGDDAEAAKILLQEWLDRKGR